MLIRCVVIGNSSFTKQCLTSLVSSFGYSVLALIQTMESEVNYINLSDVCAKNNVEYKVFDNLTSGDPAYFAVKYIQKLAPDVILLLGYDRKISDSILKIAPCISSFEGILPEYCGHNPIAWTILKKIPESGLTLYKVNSFHPYGNIVVQLKFKVSPRDTATTLFDKICALIDKALDDLRIELSLGLPSQKLFNDADIKTFWRVLTEDDYLIDWGKSCEEIVIQIKALSLPFKGARFIDDTGQTVTVLKAVSGIYKTNKNPGYLVYQDEDHYVVTTGTHDIDIQSYVIE